MPLESLVDEAVLIVTSGIRMALKNQAILSILRDGAKFELEWYLDGVRAQLAAFTEEKADDGVRAADELRKSHSATYGSLRDRPEDGEFERLERRKEMLHALVERLGLLSSDDGYLSATAFASRDAAWEEIGASVKAAAISRVTDPESLSDDERDSALAGLRAELEQLRRSRPPL